MKNLFALVGAAVVLVGGLGWYRGWYRVETAPAGTGHRTFNVDVNTARITDDVKTGKQKLHDVLAKEGETAPPAPAPAPQAAPKESKAPPVQGNVQFHPDGSVTYKADFTLPPLLPTGSQEGGR